MVQPIDPQKVVDAARLLDLTPQDLVGKAPDDKEVLRLIRQRNKAIQNQEHPDRGGNQNKATLANDAKDLLNQYIQEGHSQRMGDQAKAKAKAQDQKPTPPPTPKASGPKPTQDNMLRDNVLAQLDWVNIEKGNNKGVEVKVQHWPKIAKEALETELEAMGIRASSFQTSSAQGGNEVLRLMGDDAQKVSQILHMKEALEAKVDTPTQTIGKAEWLDVDTSSGGQAKYLDIGKASAAEIVQSTNALGKLRIGFEIKPSSLNNGTTVISVTNSTAIGVIDAAQDAIQNPKPQPSEQPTPPKKGFWQKATDLFKGTGNKAGGIGGVVFGTFAGATSLIGGSGAAEASEIMFEAALGNEEAKIEVAVAVHNEQNPVNLPAFNNEDATYSGDISLLEEAGVAGIPLHPSLLPTDMEVAATNDQGYKVPPKALQI